MRRAAFAILSLVLITAACMVEREMAPAPQTQTPSPTHTATPEENEPAASMPPVEGPSPSDRLAVFYYPWYGNPTTDRMWEHWQGDQEFQPPLDISSDYYPVLGAYSCYDPNTVAQHFAWLREAGVGVIISSWWGQGTFEDRAVPVLLDAAEQYGIRVAFHIEPYDGRTADRLLSDIEYIYRHYGDHPAFFRTTASSRWSPDDRPKGLFFVWAIDYPDFSVPPVEASYWQETVDAIHALPDGGLIIANTTDTAWVDGGHFDGLYNYATLHLDQGEDFAWALGLPPDAWYVPSVLPGFSARRIEYPADAYTPRADGATFNEQWEAALGVGVEPAMMTITSFNEWHEGTQIEPAQAGATNGLGHTYNDYEPLPPEGYLDLAREWGERFLATSWDSGHRLRIRMVTTSDWTTLGLTGGGTWLRPGLISASEEATDAWFEGERLLLTQPLARAEAGGSVEMVIDVQVTGLSAGGMLDFEIERGHLGSTWVEFSYYAGEDLIQSGTIVWDGIVGGERNAHTFSLGGEELLGLAP
jgi:glycoprotein endo-alpha-1,2-mannosidase